MNLQKISYILILSCIILSCASKKYKNPPLEMKQTETSSNERELYPQAEIGQILDKTDQFKILNVTLERNYLVFEVSYSGGCEKHEFKLVGSPNVSKSIPPIRDIQLQHLANNDKCKAIKTEKLKFSISILAIDYNNNPIKLKLWNNDQEIIYTYD